MMIPVDRSVDRSVVLIVFESLFFKNIFLLKVKIKTRDPERAKSNIQERF